jgi:CrcB protein
MRDVILAQECQQSDRTRQRLAQSAHLLKHLRVPLLDALHQLRSHLALPLAGNRLDQKLAADADASVYFPGRNDHVDLGKGPLESQGVGVHRINERTVQIEYQRFHAVIPDVLAVLAGNCKFVCAERRQGSDHGATDPRCMLASSRSVLHNDAAAGAVDEFHDRNWLSDMNTAGGEIGPGDDSSPSPTSSINRNHPVLTSVLVISVGAAAGALLRWFLAVRLNAAFPQLPPGTLLANLLGGYLIGIAMAIFLAYPALSPQWRLLTVTGFLGGLTTFSTFSAEVVTALLEDRVAWALSTIVTHVLGSVAMTLLGVGTVRILRPTL